LSNYVFFFSVYFTPMGIHAHAQCPIKDQALLPPARHKDFATYIAHTDIVTSIPNPEF